jgi:hypothetical protein
MLSIGLYAQPSVIYDKARAKMDFFLQSFPADQTWVLSSISLEGNKLTKNYIIMREVPLRVVQTDTSQSLLELLETSRLNLLNTNLFLEVIPQIDSANTDNIFIRFTFKERWYIFPLPYFNIVDRNPNQWLIEQKGSLDRINYGIKFIWENASGRRDQVRFNIINGYRREFNIYYEKPYSGKKLEHGFLIGAGYTQLRQITYATENHKQVFFPSNVRTDFDFVKSAYYAELGYTYRKGVHYRHRVSVLYRNERIADSINDLISANREKFYRPFFPGNLNQLSYVQLDYNFQYLKVNNNAYPWRGFALNAGLIHRGLGVSPILLWQLRVKAGKYILLGKKNSLAFVGFGLTRLPKEQPMYNLFGFGFGDMYIRGLEYYVIDCLSGAMLKTTLRRELANLNIPTPFKASEKYSRIPFKIVAKIYYDMGASHYPFLNASYLNNRLLYSYGLGLDIISYYDFVAQLDFSANQLGEKGLFLHVVREF